MERNTLTNIATLANTAAEQISTATAQLDKIKADYDAAHFRITLAIDAAIEALNKLEGLK